jgi:hypothetical protein
MPPSSEHLWSAERKTRKNIWKGTILIILVFSGFLLLLSAWLTQPLVSKTTPTQSQVNVDPHNLEFHVTKLSTEFYPRNYLNRQNLNGAADYIKNEFLKTGGDVSEQVFTVNGSDYRNIRLELGKASTDRIVVGAHYDAVNVTHGADDNASGIAGLLELARLFAANPTDIHVELVAFCLEEPPYFGTEQMGSFVHAKSLKDSGIPIRLMVCLEMIGYFSDQPDSQSFPLFFGRLLYPSTGNFIAVVGDFSNGLTVRSFKTAMTGATSLPIYSINAPGFVPGIDFSDHRNYWRFGYDAVMITDSAFYRNKNYHSIDDTYEKLDYLRMAEVVKATYAAVVDASK